MNQIQMQAAKRVMIEWLKHPQELGKEPERIVCAGEFERYGMRYYLFKYKRNRMGKWLLGVSGGYTGKELENCGHVYSEMREYKEETAEADAIAMVDLVRSYWQKQAEHGELQKENAGAFLAFVLLEEAKWDKEAFRERLWRDWGIEETVEEQAEEIQSLEDNLEEMEEELGNLEKELTDLERELEELERMLGEEEPFLDNPEAREFLEKKREKEQNKLLQAIWEEDEPEDWESEGWEEDDWEDEEEDWYDQIDKNPIAFLEGSEDMLIFHYKGAILSVALMPEPVPDAEAEERAQRNFRWPGAEKIVERHEAHLMVAVLGGEMPAIEAGEVMVKLLLTCCQEQGVLGIYMNETVYQPEMYVQMAEMLKKDMFPILNLVWIGLYQGERGICGYTCGMRAFGYDEMEVLESRADANEVYSFLVDLADFVIMEDELLQDGETVGFSAEEKLPITKSRGTVVEGETLKIEFHGEA